MYDRAIERVQQRIESIDGLTREAAYGRRFVRVSSDLDKLPAHSRAFTLRGPGHGTDSRSQSPSSRWTFSRLLLRVVYLLRPGKMDELDVVQGLDYRRIRDALMDQTQWSGSTIVNLSVDEPAIFTASIVDTAEASFLDVDIDLTHTEQTA